MKIKMFEKIIEIDENNPGIKFFLEDCCEFPTESFMMIAYTNMNEIKYDESTYDTMKQLTYEQLMKTLIWGILNEIDTAEHTTGYKFPKEIEYVKNAYKQYIPSE